MASGGLGCEVGLALSTSPELSVPWDVCQAEGWSLGTGQTEGA